MRMKCRAMTFIMHIFMVLVVVVSAFFYAPMEAYATESSASLPIVNDTVISNSSINQTTNLDSGYVKRVGIIVGSMCISDSLSDDVDIPDTGIYKVSFTSTIDLKYPSACNWNSILLLFGNYSLYNRNYYSSVDNISVTSTQVGYFSGQRLKQEGSLIFRCDLYNSSDVSGSVTGSISVKVNSVEYLCDTSADEYQDGYNAGFEAGESSGYESGYEVGKNSGYDTGYDEGYNSGFSDASNAEYSDGYNQGLEDGYNSGFSAGENSGYESGKSDGYKAGYQVGYDDGYDSGYDDGESDGYASGYSVGFEEARSEILTLTDSMQASTVIEKSLYWDGSYSGLYTSNQNVILPDSFGWAYLGSTFSRYMGNGYYLTMPKSLITPSLSVTEYRIKYSYQSDFVSSKNNCYWIRPVFGTMSDLYTGNFKIGSNIPGSVSTTSTKYINVKTNYSNEAIYVGFLIYFYSTDDNSGSEASFDISGTINFELTPYKIVENGNVIDSIEDQTQQQTDTLINGFDSSGGQAVNDDFKASVNDYHTAEDSLFTTAKDGLGAFEFVDFTSITGMVTSLSFVTSIMTSIYLAMGGDTGASGIILAVLFSVMLVSMAIGLYRYYVSNGKSGGSNKGGD